jgi:Leucine-rich repeat (LRR) protein
MVTFLYVAVIAVQLSRVLAKSHQSVLELAPNCTGSISSDTYQALEAFYDATGGSRWEWDSLQPESTIWRFPCELSTPCNDGWQGLSCAWNSDNTACEIQAIELPDYNLRGSLPTELGTLVNMQVLNLYANSLTGTIISDLGNLLSLIKIDLSENDLDWTIPSQLGNLLDIELVRLSQNFLVGRIPVELGHLQNMQVLDLSNNFLDWHIPSELANAAALYSLYITNNLLTNSLPLEIVNLRELEFLALSYNLLSGSLCSDLGNLTNLTELDIYSNLMTGTLPAELADLAQLEVFSAGYNYFVGSVPYQYGQLSSLVVLSLGNSLVTGQFPSEYGLLTNLVTLSIGNSLLTGTIPFQIGNLGKLTGLYADQSSLTGLLPSELGNLGIIRELFLFSNSLEGSIPSNWGGMTNLEILSLYDNSLSGAIPSQLGSIRKLQTVDLSNNMLESYIPSQIGDSTMLATFILASNLLEGSIPTELGFLTGLTALEFESNYLTEEIPSEFGNLVSVKAFLLNSNLLEGTLASELGTIDRVEQFDLSHNLLSGSLLILSDFTKDIEYLDLSSNMFSGSLALEANSWPYLKSLNLSSNRLSGRVDFLVSKNNTFKLEQTFDLSNNLFAGTLADGLFLLAGLRTIILSQNCFSGTLPSSLCENKDLENVVLDLLTGNCGSASSILRGSTLRHYMQGTVPNCLWNSSSMRVLHCMGNGLVGSLGEMSPESAFSVLGLGSNQLTGTIPVTFQLHNFTQLDLSINRLSGTLNSNLYVDTATTTVFDLSANRLSGDIPNALYGSFQEGVINVLEGNIFGCQQTDVPSADVSHSSYQCGSVDFQYSWMAWLLACCASVLFVIVRAFAGGAWSNHLLCLRRQQAFRSALTGPLWCLAVCLLGLVVYPTIKTAEGLSSMSTTHTVQYWWTSTIAFTHNWIIVLFLFIMLGILCATVIATLMILVKEKQFVDGDSVVDSPAAIAVARQICAHTFNILCVTAVNAVYVLLVTDNVNGWSLLAIQAALSIFKLGWSAKVIPWLLFRAKVGASLGLSHWIFMVLFVFLGAPFTSTFCESSSCFLYALTSPSRIYYSFSVPISSVTTLCQTTGCKTFVYYGIETYQSNIIPPWIYSYQCSSAIITNYAPVLIWSYLTSAVIVPILQVAAAVWLHHSTKTSTSGIIHKVISVLGLGTLESKNDPTLLLFQTRTAARQGRLMTVKYVLNATIITTFGLAVPLLAVAAVFDTMVHLSKFLLLQEVGQLCGSMSVEESENNQAALVRMEFWRSFSLHQRELRRSCFIVMGFVSVFWSLFAFDWIGDTYGSLAGGLVMLVPLIFPSMLTFVITARKSIRERLSSASVQSHAIELNAATIPVVLPQATRDDLKFGSGSDVNDL